MAKYLQIFGVVLLMGGLAYHFAALRIFNLLVPKDRGSVQRADAVSFGPDPRQVFDIYAPAGHKGSLPVLVFVNGGSWATGRRQDYEFVGHAFAARGYLTFVADYRLVPSARYPAFVEDAALAIAGAVREAPRFGGDAARVFLVGHSAGAYNLAQAVLDLRFLKMAGVDPAVIKGFAGLAGPYDFLPFDVTSTKEAFGGWPDAAETQPVTHVRSDAPPFLLLTGSDDTTVYPRNSKALAQGLAAAGAHAVYKEYPGVSHVRIMLALAKPLRSGLPVLEDVLQFFAAQP